MKTKSDITEQQTTNISDIFVRYKTQLKNYIAKQGLSKEDAEDVLQNVFYKLSKIDLSENPIEEISGWLYSVTRNQIIDKSRKQREVGMPYVQDDNDDSVFLNEVTNILFDDDSSPEKEYIRSLVWDELEMALEDLPAEQRDVFELTELDGLSFKEISAATNIGVNTLISRKRYAVLHLRERLRDLYEDLLTD